MISLSATDLEALKEIFQFFFIFCELNKYLSKFKLKFLINFVY